jgi:hypothetical protein
MEKKTQNSTLWCDTTWKRTLQPSKLHRCGLRTIYEFSTQYRTYTRHSVARKLFQDYVSSTTMLLVADWGSEVDQQGHAPCKTSSEEGVTVPTPENHNLLPGFEWNVSADGKHYDRLHDAITGKGWSETAHDKGSNADIFMFADLDFSHLEVCEDVTNLGTGQPPEAGQAG